MEKKIAVRASRISKEFRITNERVNNVLKGVSFVAHYGEFISILGISGSGKSTLLKCLSSLSLPTSGEVEVNGINPYQLNNSKLAKFRREDISLIFQSYNLLPALPVLENVTLPLRLSHKKVDRKQIEKLLDKMAFTANLNSSISSLSGGEQQRIGIVRAIIGAPKILLMDEPFSALDAISRKQLQELTKALHKEFGMTTIFVTHDTDEALKLGDRIAVLQDGEIRQVAEPKTILQAPATDFVANLFGGSLHV